MDKATIIEHALDLLGEHDFVAHSSTDAIATRHYISTMRECCAAHHWSFARRTRTLTPTTDHTFTLPRDCVRIKSVDLTEPGTPYPRRVPHWQLIGRTIIADQPGIALTYTADFTVDGQEPPDTAPLFTQYIIHLLAARIAPTICGAERGIQIANNLQAIAHQYKQEAITADRQQDGSNDQDHYTQTVAESRRAQRELRKYIR